MNNDIKGGAAPEIPAGFADLWKSAAVAAVSAGWAPRATSPDDEAALSRSIAGRAAAVADLVVVAYRERFHRPRPAPVADGPPKPADPPPEIWCV